MLTALDRLTALREQPTLFTGIDFIRVVDPHDETVLRIYFLTDARVLNPPFTTDPSDPHPLTNESIVIHNVTDPTRPDIPVTHIEVPLTSPVTFDPVQLDGDLQRTFIEITVDHPGDFADYRLRIDDPRANTDPTQEPFSRIDAFFNDVKFSFKAGCPDGQDCLPATPTCPPDPQPDFPIDYLARDFVSFRNALLAFAAQRFPEWVDPTIVADVGVMLAEVMAALGDELSYIQDRFAREAYLETATERRSLRKKARLLDFEIHDGVSADGLLELTVNDAIHDPDNPSGRVSAGKRVWATTEGGDPIAFEVGGGLRNALDPSHPGFNVHTEWNASDRVPAGSLVPYILDASQACLPVGATELFIAGELPSSDEVETLDPNPSVLLLRTEPADPSVEPRRHFVRVRDKFQFVDPLASILTTSPPHLQVVTRLRWDPADALPFQIDQNDLQLSLNIVPVTAGETECARFITGPDLVATPFIAVPDVVAFDCDDKNTPPPVPGTAVEREGPLFATPTPALAADVTPDAVTAGRDVRPTIFLVGLPGTDTSGLGFLGKALRETTPEVVVFEINPDTGNEGEEWTWRRSLLSAGANDPVFALEDGIWRRIITFRHDGQDIAHQDYATGAGYTVRFGDGVFGRTPPRGTEFKVHFRTGPGARANVPAGAISALTVPGHLVQSMPLFVTGVSNPVEVTTGVDPEGAAEIKTLVPEAFKAETFFALQPDDFRDQAEKLDFVQRGQGTPRWTGSWVSMFVAADPFGAFALTPDQKSQLTAWMDCVRQTGREVIVKDPKPLSIDLEIVVCIQPFAYASQVLALVQDLLVGTGGGRNTKPFFSPDNFTFGMPLRRSQLEAAIQSVPGVRFVGPIQIRKRGVSSFHEMDALIEPVDADQVLQLQNDPERPDAGTLRLIAEGGA
jgi:hypothetical protein